MIVRARDVFRFKELWFQNLLQRLYKKREKRNKRKEGRRKNKEIYIKLKKLQNKKIRKRKQVVFRRTGSK